MALDMLEVYKMIIDLTWMEMAMCIMGLIIGFGLGVVTGKATNKYIIVPDKMEPFESEPMPTDKTVKYLLEGK